jgi:hypothetical protein
MQRILKRNKPAPTVKKPLPPGAATLQDVTQWVASDLSYVTKVYQFDQYREMSLIDAENGTRWLATSSQIALFRKKDPPKINPVP